MGSQSIRLTAVFACLFLTAGCLSGGVGANGTSPTPDPTTAPPTQDGHEQAMNQPDTDKMVILRNDWNRSSAIRVQVTYNPTNETVYDQTHQLASGTEKSVYNISEADPDGIEAFTIVLTARNTTERATIETNRCYGDVYGEIQRDGTLYQYYEIC